MNTASQIATVGAIITLMGLSACVWNRGMGDGSAYDHGQNRSSATQRDSRDRNGQRCDDRGHAGDAHHDDDCRSNGR